MDAQPTDNHQTHIYTHMMVQPKTWATWFHIEMHQQLLAQQLQQQQMQAQMQQTPQMLDQQGGQNGKINVGKDKKAPQNAASPLVQATQENNPMAQQS